MSQLGHLAVSAAIASAVCSSLAMASSHREAPFTAANPTIDGTDFYMFRAYGTTATNAAAVATDSVVFIANYNPLQDPDGGPNYYAKISPGSTWMDHHILLGAWEEQPLSVKEVKYDVAMGNNIYWNLAGNPLDTKDCGGSPCRVNYNVIRAGGMHASAPDVTSKTGSETVAFEGSDEADQDYGAGFNGWSPRSTNYNQNDCIPSGSACGYTVAKFFDTGRPSSYGSPGYPVGKKPITQGYGTAAQMRDSLVALHARVGPRIEWTRSW